MMVQLMITEALVKEEKVVKVEEIITPTAMIFRPIITTIPIHQEVDKKMIDNQPSLHLAIVATCQLIAQHETEVPQFQDVAHFKQTLQILAPPWHLETGTGRKK